MSIDDKMTPMIGSYNNMHGGSFDSRNHHPKESNMSLSYQKVAFEHGK
jgi:hypothetical protein